MYEEELSSLSEKLLDEVEFIIGYVQGTLPFRTRPFLCRTKGDSQRLLFNHFCGVNLAKYLLTKEMKGKRIAILAKGCDARAINVLIKEGQVERKNLVIVGLPCHGIVSPEKLKEHFGVLQFHDFQWKLDTFIFKGKEFDVGPFLDDVCQLCLHPTPPIYDYLLGKKIDYIPRERWKNDVFKEIDSFSVRERWEFFSHAFQKCIRCYACRNSCPLCYCKECFAESQSPYWLSPAASQSENFFFQVGRILHLAGRCVECGACERACPVGIRIALL
ncbi:MAG: 4Fe-4S dicluster domain-containing protein, partial [Candidatus Caldatribacteriaceae bacterium]